MLKQDAAVCAQFICLYLNSRFLQSGPVFRRHQVVLWRLLVSLGPLLHHQKFEVWSPTHTKPPIIHLKFFLVLFNNPFLKKTLTLLKKNGGLFTTCKGWWDHNASCLLKILTTKCHRPLWIDVYSLHRHDFDI